MVISTMERVAITSKLYYQEFLAVKQSLGIQYSSFTEIKW